MSELRQFRSIDFEAIEGISKLPDFNKILSECLVEQNQEIPEPDTVLTLQEKPLFTRKSISCIIGKAKAGKSTFLAYLVALELNNIKILWIDTEQGLFYASVTQHYVLSGAKVKEHKNFKMYDLKKFNPDERIDLIEHAIKENHSDLVIIDGIRDAVYDINSSEEAVIKIGLLMKWSEIYNCHISMVLHQNKGDNNARGHLGSEAVNKSEIVLSVTKNEHKEGSSIIKAEYSRGAAIDDFVIERNDEGIPILSDTCISNSETIKKRKLLPIDIHPNTHKEILSIVFENDDTISYGQLQIDLIAAFEKYGNPFGGNKAKTFISHYIQNGYLDSVKKGNKTLYSIK